MRLVYVLKAAALAGALAVSSAHAQQVGDGAKTVPVGTKLSSVYMADSTGRVFRSDVDGNIYMVDGDRDRNFPVITSLFSSVVLNANTTYQQGTAIYVGQYTRGALMLRYSFTAADSDSVKLAVRVYGKVSINSGTLHLWTPSGGVIASGDTCFTNGRVDVDSTGVGRCMSPISFFLCRAINGSYPAMNIDATNSAWYQAPAITAGKTLKIRKVPSYALRPMGVQGTMLNLSDNAGNPCPFPYILIEVANLTRGTNLTSVSCDFWPRVN